jgi:hypothetical protein
MPTKPGTRVTGHGLVGEGAPHAVPGCHALPCSGERDDEPVRVGNYSSTGGWGHGLCQCGATSPHLSSANQRKAWHVGHKAEVKAGVAPNRVPGAIYVLTGEQARREAPELFDEHESGEQYFNELSAHGNAHWVDYWPELVVLVRNLAGTVALALNASAWHLEALGWLPESGVDQLDRP